MQEILRSNNPVEIAFAKALLGGEGIAVHHLDTHTSTFYGSGGLIEQRLLVEDDDAPQARRALSDNGLTPVPEGGQGW